jgi:hypothetical protein
MGKRLEKSTLKNLKFCLDNGEYHSFTKKIFDNLIYYILNPLHILKERIQTFPIIL